MFKFFLIFAVVVGHFLHIFSEKIHDLSFEGPFSEIDYVGDRMVSRMWRRMGTAVVQNNFIRLTSDRQSQKGALWSRRPLGVSKMSAIVKFRVSGKSTEFYGDGLALWITTQGYYTEGDVHGFVEQFTGIGIIFDTFKNSEQVDSHRDITVIVNDGTQDLKMMTRNVQGCNINIRYNSGRADFNAEESVSRAKFLITSDSIDLFIDAKNSGEWTRCVTLNKLNMPFEWLQHSHIGITASTGQLADNHDILSLQTYSDVYKMEMDQQAQNNIKLFELDTKHSVDEKLITMETAIENLMKQIKFIDHHLEHELTGLVDQMERLQLKVDQSHDVDKGLTKGGDSHYDHGHAYSDHAYGGYPHDSGGGQLNSHTVHEMIGSYVSDQFDGVDHFKEKVNTLHTNVESLQKELKDSLATIQDLSYSVHSGKNNKSSGGWMLPFFILFLMNIGTIVAGFIIFGKKNMYKLP